MQAYAINFMKKYEFLQCPFHRDMGYLCLHKDVADGFETELFVERNGLCLGVDPQRVCAFVPGVCCHFLHKVFAIPLFALNSQHAADADDSFLRIFEKACIGDHEAFPA